MIVGVVRLTIKQQQANPDRRSPGFGTVTVAIALARYHSRGGDGSRASCRRSRTLRVRNFVTFARSCRPPPRTTLPLGNQAQGCLYMLTNRFKIWLVRHLLMTQ